MITIKSSRLTVKLAEPNKEYNTCRFNRAGFIPSVVLDGKTEFCGDEHGGTDGFGFCSEITTDPDSADVAVGELFQKFGVGFLTKFEDLKYDGQKKYDVLPYETTYEAAEDSVTFFTEPKILNGCALREKKTISVHDNVLVTDYEIENAGGKTLNYGEYNHNFLTTEFDGETLMYDLAIPMENAEDPYTWQVSFLHGTHVLKGREYFKPFRCNVWSPGFCICPEFVFKKELAPGEKVTYRREVEFLN